jgi:hypothetical protein
MACMCKRDGFAYHLLLPYSLVILILGFSRWAIGDLLGDASAYRHQAMCEHVGRERRTIVGPFLKDEIPGEHVFDLVYDEWYHRIQRAKTEAMREEWFYQALCGIVVMHEELSGEELALPPGLPANAGTMRMWAGVPKTLNEAVADGLIDLRTLEPTLKATDSRALLACFMDPVYDLVFVVHAGLEDGLALVAAPLVASERAIGVIEAIQQSTDDPELSSACHRLVAELQVGARDFIARLKSLALNGELNQLLAEALLKGVTRAGVSTLLWKLGLWAKAGSVGVLSGHVFAAVAAGIEIGLWMSGDTAAFEHARLAHFASLIRPELAERWELLRGHVAPRNRRVCAALDSTSLAVILTAAYVNTETLRMRQCCERNWLPEQMRHWLTKIDVGALPQSVFEGAFRRWTNGDFGATALVLQPWPFDPVIVIDRSGSIQRPDGLMGQIERDARGFVDELLRRASKVAVVNFSGRQQVALDCPFSDSREAIVRAIERPSVGRGDTALYEAVVQAVGQHASNETAVIVFSDGCENDSRRSLEETVIAAQERGVLVVAVGYVGEQGRDAEGLRAMAESTRGFYIAAEDVSAADVLDSIGGYLRNNVDAKPVGLPF